MGYQDRLQAEYLTASKLADHKRELASLDEHPRLPEDETPSAFWTRVRRLMRRI